VASNSKERARESAQKQKKKEENTLIFNTMLSSTRRRAALNTRGGPSAPVRVKEAAKVPEMCGCAHQSCAGRTGIVAAKVVRRRPKVEEERGKEGGKDREWIRGREEMEFA
jgi:hypothetical protein